MCWGQSEPLPHMARSSFPSAPQPHWVPCVSPNWAFECTVLLTWNVLPSGLPAKLIYQGSPSLDSLTPEALDPSVYLAQPSLVMVIVSVL